LDLHSECEWVAASDIQLAVRLPPYLDLQKEEEWEMLSEMQLVFRSDYWSDDLWEKM
jgi:hypothetical protein